MVIAKAGNTFMKINYRLFLLLMFCTVLFLISPVSEMVWARSNAKSIIQTVLKDTLGSISGKIIDSLTNTPIPFAMISFYKDGAGTMTIVSDEKGEFSINVKQVKSKVQLSAIGYQERVSYLAFDHSNLFRLTPLNNLLPNVTVSGKAKKKPNANRIIKKVNEHLEQNYGDFSFDQRFRINTIARNYDTAKDARIDLVDMRFNNEQRVMQVKKMHRDTAVYDAVFLKFIRVLRLSSDDIMNRADFLRTGLVLGEKRRNKFDFRLLAHYQDEKYGSVYLVSFKPLGTTINDFYMNKSDVPLGYLKGEMLIREEDYAVISLKYIHEMKVERFNAALESLYHSAYWKADRVCTIVSNSRITKYEYSYEKDIVSGKYFVQTIKANCYETGYQIETNRKVQLDYQCDGASLGVENIVEPEGQKKGSN